MWLPSKARLRPFLDHPDHAREHEQVERQDGVPVEQSQQAMRLASEIILNAPDTPPEAIFRLRSDAKIVHHPDHYSDPRGDEFWGKLREFVPQLPP